MNFWTLLKNEDKEDKLFHYTKLLYFDYQAVTT